MFWLPTMFWGYISLFTIIDLCTFCKALSWKSLWIKASAKCKCKLLNQHTLHPMQTFHTNLWVCVCVCVCTCVSACKYIVFVLTCVCVHARVCAHSPLCVCCVLRRPSLEGRPWSWTLSSHREARLSCRHTIGGERRPTPKSAVTTLCMWPSPGGATRCWTTPHTHIPVFSLFLSPYLFLSFNISLSLSLSLSLCLFSQTHGPSPKWLLLYACKCNTVYIWGSDGWAGRESGY